MSNVLRFPTVPRCAADVDFDRNPPTRIGNMPLRYFPGIVEADGTVTACDRWMFVDETGNRFNVTCEGTEWWGRIARADGSFLSACAHRADIRWARDIDPRSPFSPFNGTDYSRPRAGAKEKPDVGSSYEYLILNAIKHEVFENRRHEVTTGRTEPMEARP